MSIIRFLSISINKNCSSSVSIWTFPNKENGHKFADFYRVDHGINTRLFLPSFLYFQSQSQSKSQQTTTTSHHLLGYASIHIKAYSLTLNCTIPTSSRYRKHLNHFNPMSLSLAFSEYCLCINMVMYIALNFLLPTALAVLFFTHPLGVRFIFWKEDACKLSRHLPWQSSGSMFKFTTYYYRYKDKGI